MKLLLDESLPKRLKKALERYDVKTIPEMGWAGKLDGEILKLATNRFDIFLTADQNLQYQQNLTNSTLGIIVLAAGSNRYDDLVELIPHIEEAVEISTPEKMTILTTQARRHQNAER